MCSCVFRRAPQIAVPSEDMLLHELHTPRQNITFLTAGILCLFFRLLLSSTTILPAFFFQVGSFKRYNTFLIFFLMLSRYAYIHIEKTQTRRIRPSLRGFIHYLASPVPDSSTSTMRRSALTDNTGASCLLPGSSTLSAHC